MKKNSPELRLLTNDKAHAHRHKGNEELEPSSDLPVAPRTLSERGTEIFNEFVDLISQMYAPSKTDTDMIVTYANNQEQLESYEYTLRTKGSTYDFETQYSSSVKARPEVAMLHQCKTLKINILGQFGLSPSSRTKVKIEKTPGKKKTNPFSEMG